MRKNVVIIIIGTILCWSGVFFSSCSTTKLIPEDDQLFIGLKKIDYLQYQLSPHFDSTKVEIEAALATKPNGALLGSSYYRTPFQYRLWIWNAYSQSDSKFAKWMTRSFGKPPVLMSQVNPTLRALVAQSVLRKYGYLHGTVSFEEVTRPKSPKKARISYTVVPDTLFTVDTMSYENFTPQMQALIDSTRSEAKIGAGSAFAAPGLDAERTRISTLFRNNGYYYYQSGYASYLADTLQVKNKVQLRLLLADSIPSETLRPWYIGNVTVKLRRSFREQLTDSLGRGFLKIYFNGKHSPIRPGVVLRNMKLRPRQTFSYDNYVESMQKVNSLGMFSSVDFQFTPRDVDTLDLILTCTFDKPYDFYIEGNVVNRTIGRMGPEVKLGVTRRNLLRGGETFDINLHGNYEWQTSGHESDMNSFQYGIDASVEFPRIVLPWTITQRSRPRQQNISSRKRRKQYYAPPSTVAKLTHDIVRRSDYYKMHIFSGEWTYQWQPSESHRHQVSPLVVKYQFMNSHTDQFDTLVMKNPFMAISMSDYFVPKMRYTYTYASPKRFRNPIRWETSIEESGNIVALYDVLIQGREWNQEEKTLFKNPYSQFLRVETDFTKTWTLSGGAQLVAHLNAGIIYSYGNSSVSPFSEFFYVGGANSIRAFPVRSIGPGAFNNLLTDRQWAYAIQNGNSKLVMNLEYRWHVLGGLYGALFLDAGNVWNSEDWFPEPDDAEDEEERYNALVWNRFYTGTKFKLGDFFNHLATGTGIGLRYDLDFLVVRLDWGFGLHLPYDTGKSGYFNIPTFSKMHSLHFAVGYPF